MSHAVSHIVGWARTEVSCTDEVNITTGSCSNARILTSAPTGVAVHSTTLVWSCLGWEMTGLLCYVSVEVVVVLVFVLGLVCAAEAFLD